MTDFDINRLKNNLAKFLKIFMVSRFRLGGITGSIGKSGVNPVLSRNCEYQCRIQNLECRIEFILYFALYILHNKARRPAIQIVLLTFAYEVHLMICSKYSFRYNKPNHCEVTIHFFIQE